MQYALIFQTKDEFDHAVALLNSSAASVLAPQKIEPVDHKLRARLEDALAMSPLNPQKATVLKTWLSAPESDWVAYGKVVDAFIADGIAPAEQAEGKASAAIRDLSWQIAQKLTSDEAAKFDKAIEALAQRSRAAGLVSYRLTPDGRLATENFLKSKDII
jgi:hypothetical protein